FFFFFQAEDGIRDFHVTGVQTCALPICSIRSTTSVSPRRSSITSRDSSTPELPMPLTLYDTHAHLTDDAYADTLERVLQEARARSEERRVGEEGRRTWSAEH